MKTIPKNLFRKSSSIKTRSRISTTMIATALITTLCLSSNLPNASSRADSFSWTEPSGLTVFGSKPPASARDIKKLKTKTLSRYSSDKVLKRLRGRASLKRSIPEAANPLTPSNNSPTKNDPQPKAKEDSQPRERLARLKHEKVLLEVTETGLEQDTTQSVSNCKVLVVNPGKTNARDISVSFEFPDGSLIPGVGPDSIDAGASAEYRISKNLLPLEIKIETNKGNENKGDKSIDSFDISDNNKETIPTPRVLLYGISS